MMIATATSAIRMYLFEASQDSDEVELKNKVEGSGREASPAEFESGFVPCRGVLDVIADDDETDGTGVVEAADDLEGTS